ncbi:MAG: glycosyltransferase [Chitinispirillaceae bacterium]|nr:glycosyltransferase [Chitinispirillaceae bacterium]
MEKKKSEKKIIVGLPAFNEERTIASIVLRVAEFADEVIVVNDGSTDKTEKLAKLAGAEVINHKENKGYGGAIRTILTEAVKRNADILVIIDADAQNNPDEIPRLIEAVNHGADLVIGSRKSQRGSTPGYRWFGQKVLAKFTNMASKQNLADTESGFRAYSKMAITKLKLRETGMAISAEMISEASRVGLKIAEVPVTVSYNDARSSQNPVVHGLSNLGKIFIFISEVRPLFFFSITGGFFILMAIIAGVWVAQQYYTTYILATGTALLAMLATMIGLFLLFTGIILNILNKHFNK